MTDQLTNLLMVKDLEEGIESLTAAIGETPLKIDELTMMIDSARQDLEKLKQREVDLKKAAKLKELDVKAIDEQLGKLNGQLFSVKTNEEYRAMLREIDGLKEKKKQVEDTMIDLMEEEEQIRTKIKLGETATASTIAQHQADIKVLEEKLVGLKRDLEEKNAEYAQVKALLSGDIVRAYERIKKARKTGISRVTGMTCEGCNASLSHQVINELKKGDKIMYCDYCGRIIIWDSKAAP